MKFKADEIASVLREEIEQYESRIDVREVGRVLEVGDGIARVYGLSGVMAGEMVEFPGGVIGLAFNLEENSVGVIILGDYLEINEGDEVRSTGQLLSRAGRRRRARPRARPAGQSARRQGPGRHRPSGGRSRRIAPGVAERQPVKRAAADRHQGHRRDDAHRPRPARADHRRPQDRQDGHRHRHDHQPEGHGREVLLRGHRPEGLDRRRRDRRAPQERGDGLHHGDRGRGQRPGPAAVHRPLRRLGDGRVLHVQRRARPDRLRRPVQAGRGLPAAVAADAAPAGPRGLSGRRLLLPQPAAGAVGQAQRRARRRLAHRAADHRDARRRGLGLHSDQRDLDHRRPDLPAARPVLRRPAAGDERRHLGLPRGRCRPDARR